MRVFDPDIRPEAIHPRQQRVYSAWFRCGECLRPIYDVLRDAPEPVTTRALAERLMAMKDIDDDRTRALVQNTVLGSLNREKSSHDSPGCSQNRIGSSTGSVIRSSGVLSST